MQLDCEQSLFLSDIEREARVSGNRARSASEREMGRAEVSHEVRKIRKKEGLLAVYYAVV